jgi:soluble lytic murein transglycosylase
MPLCNFDWCAGWVRGSARSCKWPIYLPRVVNLAIVFVIACILTVGGIRPGAAQTTAGSAKHTAEKHRYRKASSTRGQQAGGKKSNHPTNSRRGSHTSASKNRASATKRSRKVRGRRRRHRPTAREIARARQLRHAFVASSELRPMAQQLIANRTPQGYAGVLHYAHSHTGEAAAAAYMTLGQAYMEDGKFQDAAASFERANRAGQALDDYADYLGAKANFAQAQFTAAQQFLENFAQRHSDSILIDHATLLDAQVKLAQGDPQSALQLLAGLRASSLANSSAFLFTLAKANQLAGNRAEAQRLYIHIYVDYPISTEAGEVAAQLSQMDINPPFTIAESMRHADGLYLAGRYGAAAAEYESLARDPAVAGTVKENEMLARAAVATYKQTHHVNISQLARIADTDNDAGATRLYLSMEVARDAKDAQQVKALIDQLQQRFPTSRWTAEALYSAGNMALLVNDLPTAIQYYDTLADRFPRSSMASMSHWHAAWLNYRLGDKKVAAQMFDDQMARYPHDSHVAAAIYWRGVVYQEYEKNPAAAAACYRRLIDAFRQYYYTGLAEQRLASLGDVAPVDLPELASIDDPPAPELSTDVPEDDVHVERAGLLANAGLNQYILPEIETSPDSAAWGAYAAAQLYSSYGENWKALRILKSKVHSYFAQPLNAIPQGYWNLLFPQPYWPMLQRDSVQQGLDPYLVASLIRQESEFNPSAISYANAWGLMQLLPSVGKSLARQNHLRPYSTAYLLNPDVNLRLGTIYVRQFMDEFSGHAEYALAAYNAGDDRVKAWLANGPYASMPEFVESIPFTQTREYVQAILRNQQIYGELYGKRTGAVGPVRKTQTATLK